MAHQESGFNPRAVSPKGAAGVMQLMPGTARDLGVTDVYDPEQNIDAGVRYYKQQRDRFGNDDLALAAYNAGPGAVEHAGNRIPNIAETRNYVRSIKAKYKPSASQPASDPYTEIFGGAQAPEPEDDAPSSYLSAILPATLAT